MSTRKPALRPLGDAAPAGRPLPATAALIALSGVMTLVVPLALGTGPGWVRAVATVVALVCLAAAGALLGLAVATSAPTGPRLLPKGGHDDAR
ncbi:hypothetical protein [Cellulomonas denverensis]|uniref:Uncharacterized protein n=1 Tax=Cellulomonas denverensis TaxID=264297 RepID=A0A7X6R0B4_9CELL|nr:hypothetical protein [Cellulomonas denverensis]NKY24025.1 hypothetical protein [Cellulomonas denverensis]GIG27379.1 hypothetical protein Cde04nite_36230 [Cellulomonas denverensis]